MTVEEHLRVIIGDLAIKLASHAATIDQLRAELEKHASPPVQPKKPNGAGTGRETLTGSDGRQ